MKKNRIKGIIEIIVGVLLIVFGIIMIPGVTDFSNTLLYIALGCLLLTYTVKYLFLRIVLKARGTNLVISLVEFIILSFIAVATIIRPWVNIPVITEACKIVGLAFWFRGVAEILRLTINETRHKRDIYKTAFNLILVSVGTWFFVKPMFTNGMLIYAFACIIFILATVFIILGILRINNKYINS